MGWAGVAAASDDRGSMGTSSDEGPRDRDGQTGCGEDTAQLVRAALSHDREAFGELCSRFEKSVFLTVHRLLGNEADAMDAVQNTLMRSYRSLRTYDVSRPFRNWLLAIAVNEARSLLRKRQRRRLVSLDQAPESIQPVSTGSGRGVDQVAEAELREVMEKLPFDERAAFVFRYVEGRRLGEVAELMNVSERTVQRLCKGARDRLRRFLEE